MNSLLRRRPGMPLGMQLMALLVCALIAAQAVTLMLTVLLPPQSPRRWNLDEVAAALSGRPPGSELAGRLERRRMAGPPDISAPGWLVSQSSRQALADRLHRPPQDVVLAFYTQLPVGGVAVPAPHSPLTFSGAARRWRDAFWPIGTAYAGTGPGGPGGAGPMPGGFPGGHFPGGGFPGGGFPGGAMPGAGGHPGGAGHPGGGIPGGGVPGAGGQHPASAGAPPQMARGAGHEAAGIGAAPQLPGLPMPHGLALPGGTALPAPIIRPQALAEQSALPRLPALPAPIASPRPVAPVETRTARPTAEASPAPGPRLTAKPAATPLAPRSQPIPFRRAAGGLLGLAGPPFIEGDFIAAVRQTDGSWLAVAPSPEPFPNRWQMQVMVWFALSLAIVSPLAWLFARRIVRPLEGFAKAAETLGRDPSATILPLSGPAEIGRAAYAFNQMRHRLRAFVDDRTAMVGAISHDLRTPLTRLRFRVEDVPDRQREGILKEVTEMEAMIAHVLAFIRDASTPGKREMVDLAELVADTVQDARMVGARVELEGAGRLPVEVDPVGMRRLLDNLLENATKYGEHARVRLSVRDDEAVADIIDDGPGIPEEEWSHVFEPFYRTEAARTSGKPGSGLGLAVCRSIARAHGGDVVLGRGKDGFVASVSVPLVMGAGRRAA